MKSLKISVAGFAAMLIVLSISATVSAQQTVNYGTAGCGLGSVVFGTSEGIIQVFAATTNGTSASQTFGITSGTSNCVNRGVITQNKEQEAFFEANYGNLKSEMAAGEGEHLAALSSLMGCSDSSSAALASYTQTNYSAVVPNESTTPMQALYGYKLALSMDEELSQSCTLL